MEEKKINPFIIAIAVLLPSFLALAASSGTNVSQPHIAGFYGATQYEANTVITCYIISGGLMLPVTGYLVRLIGKKLLFIYSIIVFAIGCLLCVIRQIFRRLLVHELFKVLEAAVYCLYVRQFYLKFFQKNNAGLLWDYSELQQCFHRLQALLLEVI